MSFFDRPPESGPPPLPRFPRAPAWSGPPTNVLGRLVEDRVVLHRGDDVLVSLEYLRAYPQGFEFRMSVRQRDGVETAAGGDGTVGVRSIPRRRPGRMPVPSAPGPWMGAVQQPIMSLGLAEPDGVRLTNLSPVAGVGSSPDPPLLVQLGTHFVPGLFAQLYWHWGLPADGPLGFVVESEVWGIPETRVDIDAGAIARAATEAEIVWESDDVATTVMRPATVPAFSQRVTFAPEPIATGQVPDDEAAARRAIEAAFADFGATEDGELVNVESGRDLAPTMALVQLRFGGMASTATWTVDRIVFLSSTEASVWFTVWVGGGMQFQPSSRGRAVIEDGRWKVSRDTLCGLLARAGVPCPE